MSGRARSAFLSVALAASVIVVGACSTDRTTPPIPTFADTPAPAQLGAAPTQPGTLPVDCAGLLSADMLTELIGSPLGGTGVRTVYDRPAPASGRLARMSCLYSGSGMPGAPPAGAEALRVVVAAFTDPAAAGAQAAANDAAETPVGAALPVRLGAATGHWYPEGGDGLLSLTYDEFTLEITVPQSTQPSPTAEPFATDLALRMLAAVRPARPSSGTTPP